jgi:hypothetical protein
MITLPLGKGARQTPSTVATFSEIDWSVTPKFIKTEIDYSGWKTMGVSRLWSVPYAMIAGDLAGSVKKLAVEGKTSGLEEALFEVKNKDGQTVFAVYNEGVRVYVSDGAKAKKGGFAVGGFGTDKAESTKYMFVGKDSVRIYLDTNPLTKGKKSGFAVGGYDLTKGTVQDYLDVSADSVRIYIDSNPEAKKLKGGFAVGGYDMTKGVTGDYFNVSGKSDAEVINGEPRVLWYPAKEAFRSGNVLIESKDSVGLNSWASGYRSKAIGQYSQALGYQAIARGRYSTAIGNNSEANGQYSFALGWAVKAKGNASLAIGQGNRAWGDYSAAIGYSPNAIGYGAMAFGYGAAAKAEFAFATGFGTQATSYSSLAMGNRTIASGDYSTTLGKLTIAPSSYETVLGYCNTKYTPVSTTGWDLADRLFVIGNGSEETRSDALVILKNGNVGIGTSTPDQRLVVYNGTTTGKYTTSGWTHSSDIRLKENILPITHVLSEVLKLQGVRFNFISDNTKTRQIGFIAQDFEKVFPEFVVSDNDGYKSISYGQISAILVEAIREQQQIIEKQQSEINHLKSLETELSDLKALVNSLIANQTALVE